MRPHLVIAGALGALYGVIATAVHLAMFRGYLPAPAESWLPLAIVLYIVRAPFIAAIYLSTFALGRSSPTLAELVIEALIFGALAGVLVVLVTRRSRRTT
jgi:membrane associated rhomboid family serine protease